MSHTPDGRVRPARSRAGGDPWADIEPIKTELSRVPGVLPQVSEELRGIAKALDAQAPILPIPEIPLPPRQTRPAFSRRRDQERPDDEIPF
jgi:hypothetical protein